ncbi:MAG TPA: JAB domain-containing protein [Clostridia bacterium]|jgi:DNA repair protein RadC|nr:JAB domain-containing protein [Clostridia bacterium]
MTKEKTNVHEGHRERVKSAVLANGLESMQPHQVLEYLLFFAIPLKDTNELAHELIDRFGSLSSVLDANYNDLIKVKGMTKNAALFLHTLPDVFSIYERIKNNPRQILNINSSIPYLRSLVNSKSDEHLYMVMLDAKNGIIRTERLASGSTSVALSSKEIIRIALLHQAKSVILCHNHPSDNVTPSDADINSTASIRQTLAALDIKLIDHIIIAKNSAYSFFLKAFINEQA